VTSVATRDNPSTRIDQQAVEALIAAEGGGVDGTSLQDYVADSYVDIKAGGSGNSAGFGTVDGAPGEDAGQAYIYGGTGDDGSGGDGAQIIADGGKADGTDGDVIITARAVTLNGDPMATQAYVDAAGGSPVASAAALIYAFNAFR
jgi:hypothetical protein